MKKWEHRWYHSGSQVVCPEANFAGAYYLIGHLAADTEGDAGRADVGQELRDWLNGGEEPWWMEFLNRTGPRTVVTPHGCEIQATGPMIDTATPPEWGNWKEDDAAPAETERSLMTDVLQYRRRDNEEDL